MLYGFVTDVGRHVKGVPANENDGTGLIQSIRPEHETFRKAIRDSAPNFLTYETSSKPEGTPEENAIYIDEVLQKANDSRTRELPGHYPFLVQKTYIKMFIDKWKTPSLVLSKTVFKTLLAQVNILVKKHFEGFRQGDLERHVSAIVQQRIKGCLDKTEERISWLLRTEEYLFSLNADFYTDQRSKYFVEYRGTHQNHKHSKVVDFLLDYKNGTRSVSTYVNGRYIDQPTGVAKVLSSLAEIGLGEVKAEDLPKLFSYNQMEPAIIIMANVRAYFEVAHKRYVDNVPLAIDLELVRGIEENLIGLLMAGLGINSSEGDIICKDFSEENPQTAERRAELQKKVERLENAYSELVFPGL